MIIKKIDIPIYFGRVFLIFDKDLNKVDKKYNLELASRNFPAFVQSKIDKEGVSRYFLVFNIKRIDHETIAHEITHVANWVFHDRNIKLDILNDEPYAYLVGWITEQVYKTIKKEKIKVLW